MSRREATTVGEIHRAGEEGMDYLWTPWRYRYVTQAGKDESCVFCEKLRAAPAEDRVNLILYRGRSNFILLNLYPYTTGHTMIACNAHIADIADAEHSALVEMLELARRVQAALAKTYHPEGYNLGMNIGRCAGAGVANHIHLHILPRWNSDSNFMSVIAETRVQPEDLKTTYDKLLPFFRHPTP